MTTLYEQLLITQKNAAKAIKIHNKYRGNNEGDRTILEKNRHNLVDLAEKAHIKWIASIEGQISYKNF